MFTMNTTPEDPTPQSISQHSFSNESLLRLALTHSSCNLASGDNQRLEFLGDAVLDLIIAETLYQNFPQANEGALDRSRASIVNGKSLAKVATSQGLARHLKVGEAHRGAEPSHAMLEDALEALIGAVYLDGGIEAARKTILHLFGDRIDAIDINCDSLNPKGQLQEWSQKRYGGEMPAYTTFYAEGPGHDRRYSTTVSLGGKGLGRGTGSSKKSAEIDAAKAALKALN